IPYSLDIEPPPEPVASKARALAREVGLDENVWANTVASVDSAARLRIRLGRALALDPLVALLEHPTADLSSGASVLPLGRDCRAIVERRGLAALTLTADRIFASAIAHRVLTLDPATGRLKEGRRGWFRRE